MQRQIIYFLDEVPGESVEEKAYGIIAEGYDAAGYKPQSGYSIETEVMGKFRIPHATRMVAFPEEWEVTVEGNDQDIKEYQEILRSLE